MKDAVAHTFVATVEDRPGALNRVVSLFRRRGLDVNELLSLNEPVTAFSKCFAVDRP